MKNNRIKLSQFWAAAFVMLISASMFLGNELNLTDMLVSTAVLGFSAIFVSFYRGGFNKILKTFSAIYLFALAALSAARFSLYMDSELGYGHYYLMAFILCVFVFFCAVKGIEALARAGAIITAFAAVSVVYMLMCSFGHFRPSALVRPEFNIYIPLYFLAPAAAFVLLRENIIINGRLSSLLYPCGILLLTIYFAFSASGAPGEFPAHYITINAKIGVFRGCDCLLLSLYTLAALYAASLAICSCAKQPRRRYCTNAVLTALIFAVSVIIKELV